jgi:hypothetical protein
MDVEKRSFWIAFALLVATAALTLAGALIGKTVPGYILYGVGLAGVIALFVLAFIKKDYFKEGRLKPLILGLVLGLLLASSILLLVKSTGSAMPQMPGGTSSTNGFTPGGRSGSSGFPQNGQFTNPSGTGRSGSTTFPSGMMTNRTVSSGLLSKALGWLLLGCGVIVLAIALLRFLTKKVSYEAGRWKVLLLGFVVAALIGASTVLMFGASSARVRPNFTPGQGFPTVDQTGALVAPTMEAVSTATATPAPTLDATKIAATATASAPEPTATATPASITQLVVCLDADYQVGLNIRAAPSETANLVGAVPPGGCFTLNGRAAVNVGWYRLAPGQNNFGGIRVYVDDSKQDIWVYAINTDASQSNLDSLLPITIAK